MTRTLGINALELKKETDGEDSLGEDNRAAGEHLRHLISWPQHSGAVAPGRKRVLPWPQRPQRPAAAAAAAASMTVYRGTQDVALPVG